MFVRETAFALELRTDALYSESVRGLDMVLQYSYNSLYDILSDK